ncbi:MAG: hypothetical protein GY861_03015 [bacterium]|nr:hypothetical protein [bacterium]
MDNVIKNRIMGKPEEHIADTIDEFSFRMLNNIIVTARKTENSVLCMARFENHKVCMYSPATGHHHVYVDGSDFKRAWIHWNGFVDNQA